MLSVGMLYAHPQTPIPTLKEAVSGTPRMLRDADSSPKNREKCYGSSSPRHSTTIWGSRALVETHEVNNGAAASCLPELDRASEPLNRTRQGDGGLMIDEGHFSA